MESSKQHAINSGDKFGHLIVIKSLGHQKRTNANREWFLCHCTKCGNQNYETCKIYLQNGTKTCGCTGESHVNDNLIGKIFGALTIVEDLGTRIYGGHKRRFCKVKCNYCDSLREYVYTDIKNGHNSSCGCRGLHNEIGKKYGKLTVLSKAARKIDGQTRWICKCDCGNNETIDIIGAHLRNNSITNCGCEYEQLVKNGEINRKLSKTLRIYERFYHPRYLKWRETILSKYEYRCDICKSKNRLQVHHLYSYQTYPELRYDLENGVCLCRKCHVQFHSLYGNKNNTKEQFIKFKKGL